MSADPVRRQQRSAFVPLPVLGRSGLALFGTVAASGIRRLSRVNIAGYADIVIVAFAIGRGICDEARLDPQGPMARDLGRHHES